MAQMTLSDRIYSVCDGGCAWTGARVLDLISLVCACVSILNALGVRRAPRGRVMADEREGWPDETTCTDVCERVSPAECA